MPRRNIAWFAICLVAVIGKVTKADYAATYKIFEQYLYVTWSPSHVVSLDGGRTLELRLDNSSGSGFASKGQYMFGYISMQIKLIPGNSAGTVTAYYMSSQSANRDELDFEFLGNVPGESYILQTNVFTNGIGNREQRMSLWFDPTTDFHTYSFFWNQHQILFLVDNIPIRSFENYEKKGVAFPSQQPMGVFSSIWNGDQWATRGGLVKIDWTQAPFIATYQNFVPDACETSSWASSDCESASTHNWWNEKKYQKMSPSQKSKLEWIKSNYLIYDYCADAARYPTPPPECID
ncbi:hypothetical protein O6H91_02G147300 [Diphasiastrum complanatum]|uniref:Uncharacterized protein n=1 Tax=Diphasiastrum complanatum TaxID=34168 RepID=A0ACC2ELV7_DIPCM|nr:hypothetical protein O6H91_Y342000 [Diphasiastrum complanatum]KAJ7567442.1 hypothetical protein O6H91_02G147300 [Diphasiastrum complanatum]